MNRSFAPLGMLDITLSYANGAVITILGESQPLIQDENLTGYGSGLARRQGTFSASYRLPCDINAEQVTANYQDGVLEIHLAKAETAKVRHVKVPVHMPRSFPLPGDCLPQWQQPLVRGAVFTASVYK